MLFQALFGLLLGGEDRPFKRCRLEQSKSLRAPSKEAHFPCSTAKWNHVFSGLHANCWSGGSECSPPLLYETSYCEKTGLLSTLDSNLETLKRGLIYQSAQQMSELAGIHVYLCFLPFLGSWWRSWSVRKQTRPLGPGGRPSAPPLLPCGEPEGSHGSSKAYLRLQVPIINHKIKSKEVVWRFWTRERRWMWTALRMFEKQTGTLIKRRRSLEKHVERGNKKTTQSTGGRLNNKMPMCGRADRNQCFYQHRGWNMQVWLIWNGGDR